MKSTIRAVESILAQDNTISDQNREKALAILAERTEPIQPEGLKQGAVAQMISVTRQTIASMEKRGLLHPMELWAGGPKRYSRTEVLGLLKASGGVK